jgi:hypothetical protein
MLAVRYSPDSQPGGMWMRVLKVAVVDGRRAMGMSRHLAEWIVAELPDSDRTPIQHAFIPRIKAH